MSANEHQGIFPSFIIPSGTVSGSGPKCTMKPLPKSHGRTALLSPYPLKAYETMEVDQLENRALLTSSGWMLEFEEDVLVSQGGIAAGPSTAGSTEPSRTKIAVPTDGSIDSLIIVCQPEYKAMYRGAKKFASQPDSLRSATFRHHTGRPEEPVLRFNLGPSGVQGVHVSRIGLQDFEVIPLVEQAKSIAEVSHHQDQYQPPVLIRTLDLVDISPRPLVDPNAAFLLPTDHARRDRSSTGTRRD
jgi:hypothetical protein